MRGERSGLLRSSILTSHASSLMSIVSVEQTFDAIGSGDAAFASGHNRGEAAENREGAENQQCHTHDRMQEETQETQSAAPHSCKKTAHSVRAGAPRNLLLVLGCQLRSIFLRQTAGD